MKTEGATPKKARLAEPPPPPKLPADQNREALIENIIHAITTSKTDKLTIIPSQWRSSFALLIDGFDANLFAIYRSGEISYTGYAAHYGFINGLFTLWDGQLSVEVISEICELLDVYAKVAYNSPMPDIRKNISNLADALGITSDALPSFEKLVFDFAANASAATKHRGARPDRSPEEVAAMLKDSILGRLQEKFEKQLREIELPEGGFTTIEQAKAGWALDKTFRDLQKRREKMGLVPIDKPDRVTEAASMAGQYYAHHNETGEFIPPKPRGRPRKVVQPGSAPAT